MQTGYGLEGRGAFPGRGNISLFFIASTPAPGPTEPPIQWYLTAVSPLIKRPRRQADEFPPSSAEVKNGGAITPPQDTSSRRDVLVN
jgi:hypothetical protein